MTRSITRRTVLAGGLGAATAVLLERRLRAAEQAGSSVRTDAKVLVFDTFGTVVDWRSSVTAEGERLGRAKGLKVDWAAFADAWRGGYGPSMNRVRRGEVPWTKLDVLHRQTLDGLLDKFGITTLTEEEKQHFNRAWHRLKPWPDAVAACAAEKGVRDCAALEWQPLTADQHGQASGAALGLHPLHRARAALQARPRDLPDARRVLSTCRPRR